MNDNLVPRAFSLALGAGPWERGPWERGCMNEASSRTGAWGSLYPSSMIDVYFFSLSLFFPVSGRILEMRKKNSDGAHQSVVTKTKTRKRRSLILFICPRISFRNSELVVQLKPF